MTGRAIGRQLASEERSEGNEVSCPDTGVSRQDGAGRLSLGTHGEVRSVGRTQSRLGPCSHFRVSDETVRRSDALMAKDRVATGRGGSVRGILMVTGEH